MATVDAVCGDTIVFSDKQRNTTLIASVGNDGTVSIGKILRESVVIHDESTSGDYKTITVIPKRHRSKFYEKLSEFYKELRK